MNASKSFDGSALIGNWINKKNIDNNQLKILHSACTMYSSQAWDLVGEMDHKNFHFYGTENDWSYRARSIGFKLFVAGSIRISSSKEKLRSKSFLSFGMSPSFKKI